MTEEYLEKSLNFIRDKAQQYAQAKANRVYLMEFKKVKKAQLMIKAEQNGYKTTSAQEREAYANIDYVTLLEGLRAAVEKEEELRYQLKGAELKVDVWRSKEASKRAERARYGA